MTLSPSTVCQLCKGAKVAKNYNAATVGVTMRMVWLCPPCDLSPDPPVVAGARETA